MGGWGLVRALRPKVEDQNPHDIQVDGEGNRGEKFNHWWVANRGNVDIVRGPKKIGIYI